MFKGCFCICRNKIFNCKKIYYSEFYDKTFEEIQSFQRPIEAYFQNTFDLEKQKQDNNYIEEYYKTTDPIIKQIANERKGLYGIYITYNPLLYKQDRVYTSWYMDADGQGFKKVEDGLTKASFNESD